MSARPFTCGLLLAILGALVATQPVLGEWVDLRIRQARIELPEIIVYVDVPDLTTVKREWVHAALGNERLDLVEAAQAREAEGGVAYLFLVDISRSLRPYEFKQLRTALAAWIQALSGRDRAALLTVGDHPVVAHPYTSDRDSLLATLNELRPSDQKTQLYGALLRALDIARRRDPDLPQRRAIVVLSDGWNDGFGVQVEQVIRKIREVSVPIYAIGYSHLVGAERGYGFDILRSLAESSKGIFVEGRHGSLGADHESIRRSIDSEWRLRFACPKCRGDGRPQILTVELDGPVAAADSADLRVLPARLGPRPPRPKTVAVSTPTAKPGRSLWPLIVGASFLLLLIAGVALYRANSAQPMTYDPFYGHRLEGTEEDLPVVEPLPLPPAPVPAVGGKRIRLVVVRGRRPGRVYRAAVPKRFTVGSDESNAVVLRGEKGIEGVHFEVEIVGRELRVRDLTGRRRTSVNGVPVVGRFETHRDDLILAGRTELRILVEAS